MEEAAHNPASVPEPTSTAEVPGNSSAACVGSDIVAPDVHSRGFQDPPFFDEVGHASGVIANGASAHTGDSSRGWDRFAVPAGAGRNRPDGNAFALSSRPVPDLETEEAALEQACRGGLLPNGEPVDAQDSVSDEDQSYSEGGYESSDDMDASAARHCVNCTAPVWGDTCADCGHIVDADTEIFAPTVLPETSGRSLRPGEADAVLAYDERFLLHCEAEEGSHPERPDRVRAVWALLEAAEVTERCRRIAVRPATDAEIVTCHDPELVARVDSLSARLSVPGAPPSLSYCSDTYVNAHTAMCARLSAGACVDVATSVTLGQARSGVAVVRPPGHHAESNTAMGFCYYNNAAVAARAAQAAGAHRLLIVDWDVHHGNGTQHIFEDDPSVLYVSLHRYDSGTFYPGTGGPTEVGRGAGVGTSVNIAWPHGEMGDGDYLSAFDHVVVPIAREFSPDLIIISAGFDAVDGDPIGGCLVTPACYGHLTASLLAVAPTVALLEGGYNLLATARSTLACVRVILGERPERLEPGSAVPTPAGASAISLAMRVQARHWRSMRALVARMMPPAAVPLIRAMHAPGTPPGDPLWDETNHVIEEASAAATARSYEGASSPAHGAAVDSSPAVAPCEEQQQQLDDATCADRTPIAVHGLAALSTPSTSGEGARVAAEEAASLAAQVPDGGDEAPSVRPTVERIWERGASVKGSGVSKRTTSHAKTINADGLPITS